MIFLTSPSPYWGWSSYGGDWSSGQPGFPRGVAVGAYSPPAFHAAAFLRMSTTGLTAQAFGAKKSAGVTRRRPTVLLLALGAGVMIGASHAAFIELAFTYCRRNDAVLAQARRLEIRWLKAPRHWRIWCCLGWLLGAFSMRGRLS